ncbi:nucleolin-like isoform 1-T2 [Spinachia spinachia]
MAKKNATRLSTRQRKVVTSKVEEVDNVETDCQMDTVIEVKPTLSTVTVSLDEKGEEVEADDAEKRTNASDQMMDSEDIPLKSTETEEEIQKSGDPRVDIVVGSTSTVFVTCEKNEEEQSNGVKKESKGAKKLKKTQIKGKRNASSSVESSPPKKTKLNKNGYCVYVGNLNVHKTFHDVKDSLAKCLMNQSILVQDIRLDQSKSHAFVDLASEMDLTKCLTLDGEVLHDKPITMSIAKFQRADTANAIGQTNCQKAKDEKCLFLKNVPYNTTKDDLLKVFSLAVDVRFPGGADGPTQGIAFVEFENKTVAQSVLQQKQGVVIEDRILVVDSARKTNRSKVIKATGKKEDEKAEVVPNNTLFVSNLPYSITEDKLKKIFVTAVGIDIPKGRSKGFAFVTFASVEDAEKAMKATQNIKILKKPLRVQFSKAQKKSGHGNVLLKTLVVMGLTEKTTAENLKMAFEGAISARIPVHKETGTSRGFGFLEFESEENCKAVKDAMEDCEIDGCTVTVAYAKPNRLKAPVTSGEQPAGPEAGSGGRG